MDKDNIIKGIKLLNKWKILNGGILMITIFSIPSGIISWIFWPHGWKIAVASLIVFLWCFLVHGFIKKIEEELIEKKRKGDAGA